MIDMPTLGLLLRRAPPPPWFPWSPWFPTILVYWPYCLLALLFIVISEIKVGHIPVHFLKRDNI